MIYCVEYHTEIQQGKKEHFTTVNRDRQTPKQPSQSRTMKSRLLKQQQLT